MRPAVVAFDADDTLWDSESHFDVTESRFVELLTPFAEPDEIRAQLLAYEQQRIAIYGYGIKSFTLSMIEVAIDLSGEQLAAADIREIVRWGQAMLEHPVELVDGAESTIAALAADHRLLLITKGDLHHQRRKVFESGLAAHFEGIEVVAEKDPATYREVLERHGVRPEEFMMVGNSMRSDIAPVIAIGGRAVHVPYHLTWGHEQFGDEGEPGSEADAITASPDHFHLSSIVDVPELLDRLSNEN